MAPVKRRRPLASRRLGLVAGLATALILIACAPRLATPSVSSLARTERPVALTYLGVAGWRIDDGSHVLLVDPYFSRTRVEQGSVTLSSDENLIARYAPARADAILVGHSHYDHLLDVPNVAKRTGAIVVGSQSTLNVARAAGVSEQHLIAVLGGETFEFGPFSVRAILGLHAVTGVPNATIARDVRLPMTADAYAEGGTFQYLVRVESRAILFIGSGNFVETELRGLRPDVAIVATRGRQAVADYACRLMRALGRPQLVLANHFDAHWEPLGVSQMNLADDDRADLAAFTDEIRACSPTTRVVVPTHLQPIAI
ncbi:MAG: secreted protein [Myxococcaceae bacterium]|nr:secreted protein [Myxococcaceae bacterium]